MPIDPGLEEDESADAIETHPFNIAAMRRRGGYWNEESLPVTDWEIPDHRLVLPKSLQDRSRSPTAVLRWSKVKRNLVVRTRSSESDRLDRLSDLLATWEYFGINPETPAVWEVLFREHGRWYVAVFGPDRNESWNMLTMHPLRDNQFNTKSGAEWMTRKMKK